MTLEEYQHPYGFEGAVSPRTLMRGAALSTMAWAYRSTGALARALAKPRVQFLYLHHLFPEEEAGFRALLAALQRTQTLISYSEAVDRLWHDQLDRPYVCFSFDDGLRQNLRAAQILHEFGVSACFFICPGFVGETSPDKLKEICATRFKMPPTEMLSWDDVDAMLALGQEIGSHTQTHQVLSRISAAALEDELGQSFDEFNQRLGGVKHFAWPEGRFWHFSATAAKAVFAAGYESCASAERGCHISAPDWPRPNLCLRRDYVSAHWPLSHTFYFLCRGSQNASVANNHWPAEWTDVIC
ncbi:MAG: polysaccharide deacetylase family protein [Acidobacteriota bacterium]